MNKDLTAIKDTEEKDDSIEQKRRMPKETRWDRLAKPIQTKRTKSALFNLSPSPRLQRVNTEGCYAKDKECTFRPQLNTNYNWYGERSKLGMHERNQLWMEARQQRIEEEKEHSKNKDLVGCTFKPDIVLNRI